MAQVRMLKTSYTGKQLADGHPTEIGQFLDETRALSFDEIPPYSRFLNMFESLYLRSGFGPNDESLDWNPVQREYQLFEEVLFNPDRIRRKYSGCSHRICDPPYWCDTRSNRRTRYT